MKTETYFLIHYTGVIYRCDIRKDDYISMWEQLPIKLAQQSNKIIKMTTFGRGYTVKNREVKKEYFSKSQMVLLSLQAETL